MSFCMSKECHLKKDTLQFLYEKDEGTTKLPEVFGGILSNLHYAWLVRKSRIVVINCKNASRVGSWDFGNTIQDDTAEINKVEEIQRPNGKEPHLIIALNCETRGGMICIFDFVGSKIIRSIQIVDNITSVHVIDRGQDLFSLSGPLRNFDGVLAVGTVGGNVYILDICRQLCYEGFNSFEARDEMNPCQIKIITAGNLLDLENCKKIALCNESHLAIFLNVVQNKKTEHFVLKGPGGSDVLYVNKEEVLISSLHYCPQLSSILVGYNFGAFQLWDLMSMELVYTSPICEDHIPIIKFAIQEPSDDPRAFCYVWAVYSTEELESKVLPNLVMYSLCYESKEFHENYGVLYENFQYCSIRFQRELGFDNNLSNVRPLGGKCLNLDSLVLKNSSTTTEIYGNDGTEDALSLCVVAWKAICESGQFAYMTIFDLNQWYKAQMPNSSNFDDCSSYMITLCISELTNTDGENKMEVLDVNLNKKTIQQFIGTQRLEEHYYPSSLSFETTCLLEHKTVNIQYQGVQTALLCQLQKAGPLSLIRPSETYQEIVALGLTPLFVELNTTSAITSLNNQREVILSVALEQQLTSWLCKCASEWANGSFSSAGCSLDLLISWAHRRVITLKEKCDDLCVPLFDYSDIKLDTNTINVLSNCIRQIKNISFLFSYIFTKFSSYLTNGETISELCNHLKMVDLYFDVLQWFFNVGLLPEFIPLDHNDLVQEDKVRAPYPIKELEEYYMKKRSDKRFSTEKSALFIDNLISEEFGSNLEKDWKKDGGKELYPPISIQALLRTYLLRGIEAHNKHTLLIYLLSDLAVILDSQYEPLITNLMKFPAVFKVSPSYIKITHAFWQLDHDGFHHAMEQLLDPMVNQEDLKNWHHKVALKSLLLQEQHNLALLYMNVRKPPIVDDEDVLCALSLFISNNMLDEAFYLEKNYSNYSSSKSIIKHLFTECCNYGRLGSIIYRNLTPEEEKQFLKYLNDVKHPEAADLKITYFMQRSHYKEAFNTYQACEDDPNKKGLISRLNLKARDQIVHSYKKFLPTVSYDFIESCMRDPNPRIWKEVSRPDPMSVCVYKADTKTEYKSSMILAAIAKAKLTFNENAHNTSLLRARTEEIPFLRTPTAAPSQKRSSVQVIIPKIVMDEEEEGPSPPKRSRLSFSSPHKTEKNSSILSTPIIARKVRSYVSPIGRDSENITTTPASILKVRSSYKTDINNISTPTASSVTPSQTIMQHKSFISGRKSTRTSIVRFDVPSSSPEEQSSSMRSSIREVRTPERNDSISSEISSKSILHSITPKNISDTDETFYSPNSSLNNIEELPNDTSSEEKNDTTDKQSFEPTLKIAPKIPVIISKAELVKLVDYNTSSSDGTVFSSPKARKSYRKSISDATTIRSSPRLSRSRDSIINGNQTGESNKITKTEEGLQSPSTLRTLRKSLNQQVLEANTLARIAVCANKMETTRTEIFKEETKRSSIVIGDKTSEISQTTIEHADSYMKESWNPGKISENHSISTSHSYIAETSLVKDTSESLFKVDNNATLGVSDSILKELEEDLLKPPTQAAAGHKKGIAREQTPLRMTRTSSRKQKRTSSFDSHEQSPSENGKELAGSENFGQRCKFESVEGVKTSIQTSTSSVPSRVIKNPSEEKCESESGSQISKDDIVYQSGENCGQSPLPKQQMTSKLFTSSTPYSSKQLKINRTKKSKHTLSRQVLENNAISRLISEYETEEMEVDKETILTEDEEMTESSCQISDKQSNISVSDSVLEMIAFGKLPRGKELDKYMGSSEKQFETIEVGLSGESKMKVISETITPKMSDTSISDVPQKIISARELPEEKEVLENHKESSVPVEQDEPFVCKEDILNRESSIANPSNISLSDSVLEILAFGKLNRDTCGNSLGPTEKHDVDKSTETTKATTSRKNEVSFGIRTEAECEGENMSLVEVCSVIYDDLDEESQQNNSQLNINLDQAFHIGMSDHSTDNIEQKYRYEHLGQDDITHTVSERNISDNNSPDVIEILSSDGSSTASSSSSSKTSTSDDYLDKNIVESLTQSKNIEPSCDLTDENDHDFETKDVSMNEAVMGKEFNVATFEANSTMPSVIFISETNNKSNKSESNSETFPEKFESDEITNSRKSDDIRIGTKEQKRDETEEPLSNEAVGNEPGRRITRRSSKLMDDQDETEGNKSTSLREIEEVENVGAPKSSSARRVSSRRSSQGSKPVSDPTAMTSLVDPVPEQPIQNRKPMSARKRPRSVDAPVQPQIDDKDVPTSKSSEILRARRKLRSASVDIPCTIDEELKKEKSVVGKIKKRSSSVTDSFNPKEDEKNDNESLEAIKEDLVENYKKGRRLTRRQANILERSVKKVDLSSMDTQDPIELLDRAEFEGIPDPQEQKVYETSPSSCASVPRSNKGRPARRLSRTSSNASDDSVLSSISATGRRKILGTDVDSPTPRVTRRNLRSASTEEHTENKSPEQIKDKVSDILSDDSAESDASIISTRIKKSTKSDMNTSKTRKRKIASKSALPEIMEENNEVASGSPAQNTRRGRKNVQK